MHYARSGFRNDVMRVSEWLRFHIEISAIKFNYIEFVSIFFSGSRSVSRRAPPSVALGFETRCEHYILFNSRQTNDSALNDICALMKMQHGENAGAHEPRGTKNAAHVGIPHSLSDSKTDKWLLTSCYAFNLICTRTEHAIPQRKQKCFRKIFACLHHSCDAQRQYTKAKWNRG